MKSERRGEWQIAPSNGPGALPRSLGLFFLLRWESNVADYPCDRHHARYAGESTRLYLNVYRGDQAVAFRLSVCRPCLDDLVAPWLQDAVWRTAEGYWDPPLEVSELEPLLERAGAAVRPSKRRP